MYRNKVLLISVYYVYLYLLHWYSFLLNMCIAILDCMQVPGKPNGAVSQVVAIFQARQTSILGMHNQHGYLQSVPYGINGFTIKPIFHTAMAMGANHQQFRF